MEGVIFDIKRFALHDGPGIRTTVFLKGCPLRCVWCHNPESQPFGVKTVSGRDGDLSVGRMVSLDALVSEIERDMAFYDESGGGVTFSGGEPLAQPGFLAAVLDRCGALDLHRAVDTCGHASLEVLLNIATRTDLFLYDLKLAGDAPHAHFTGVAADLVQDNLKALSDTKVAIELRIPVIPGITDGDANLEALAKLIGSLSRSLPVRLLSYHRAAMDKYPRFGLTPPLPDTAEPTDEAMAQLRSRMKSLGVEVQE